MRKEQTHAGPTCGLVFGIGVHMGIAVGDGAGGQGWAKACRAYETPPKSFAFYLKVRETITGF